MTHRNKSDHSPESTDAFREQLQALLIAAQRNGVDVCGGYDIRLDGREEARFDVQVTAVERSR